MSSSSLVLLSSKNNTAQPYAEFIANKRSVFTDHQRIKPPAVNLRQGTVLETLKCLEPRYLNKVPDLRSTKLHNHSQVVCFAFMSLGRMD